jgi:adenylate cyclase
MNAALKIVQSQPVAVLIISMLVVLAVLGLRSAGHLESMELSAYDWFARLLPEDPAPDSRIVLIGVTENDIRRQQRWPLTDATLAQALDALLRHRPRVIGIDIYRDFQVPPGGPELDALLTGHPNIIAVMKFGGGAQTSIAPPPVLQHTDQIGFNDLLVDRDGIVRRGLLFLDDGRRTHYSFPLRLALLYLRASGITPQSDPLDPVHLRLGPTTFRPLEANDGAYVDLDARGYQVMLDFKGAAAPFQSFSLTALLSGQINPESIKDKIVLMGVMAESVPDLFHTPYSSGLGAERRAMYGVLVHAHIVGQLLRAALNGRATPTPIRKDRDAMWIMLWGLMGSVLGLGVRSPWRFALSALGGLTLLAFLVHLAFLEEWWLSFVPPALAWLVSSSLITAYVSNQEKRDRALLMNLFRKHVSQEIAETIWAQRDQFLDGGRLRTQKVMVTVLFTDLEGFTPVSEKMEPQALLDWLNDYMETMAQLVIQHGGIIDDYYGDSIKADFGVPFPRSTDAEIGQDARNAVECALAMEQEMERLNMLWSEQRRSRVRMRIGINTGPAVAGSLGTAQRLKFTTIGDTVNVASRLESFDKDASDPHFGTSPCRILVSESTLRYLGDHYRVEQIGVTSLKGKEEKIVIHRLVGWAGPAPSKATQEERV